MFEKIKLASEILLSEIIRPLYDEFVKARKAEEERIFKQSGDRR